MFEPTEYDKMNNFDHNIHAPITPSALKHKFYWCVMQW